LHLIIGRKKEEDTDHIHGVQQEEQKGAEYWTHAGELVFVGQNA
jgi:hypothetical protein